MNQPEIGVNKNEIRAKRGVWQPLLLMREEEYDQVEFDMFMYNNILVLKSPRFVFSSQDWTKFTGEKKQERIVQSQLQQPQRSTGPFSFVHSNKLK